MKKLVDRICSERRATADELAMLLRYNDNYLQRQASKIALKNFDKKVYLRALIEISSYCRNNCYYCGLRRDNVTAIRYRLSTEEILECCRKADEQGYRTFVLQGGEDVRLSDEWITNLITEIRGIYPHHAITLSLGERSDKAYEMFRKAGANRYLLRHETYNANHYALLHPNLMSQQNRLRCLYTLKNLGYEVGSGMMIGSPLQTDEHLVEDILFLQDIQPQMIGIGPFIPAKNTPFENYKSGSVEKTLRVISILRLLFPYSNIPATTALATLKSNGERLGILFGANVIMPNFTPQIHQKHYAIYENKFTTYGDFSWIENIGRIASKERGNALNF